MTQRGARSGRAESARLVCQRCVLACTKANATRLGSYNVRFVALAERWERRWRARTAPHQRVAGNVRTVRVFEAIKLKQDPSQVWQLLAPAESSVLLTPDKTSRAFTVPGTGPGVGEQQCHVDHDGQATIMEVVEFIEERRAVAVVVSPRPQVPVRLLTTLEPLGTGCVLTHGMEFEIPAQAEWPEEQQDAFQAYAVRYLGRVRRALDDEAAASPSGATL